MASLGGHGRPAAPPCSPCPSGPSGTGHHFTQRKVNVTSGATGGGGSVGRGAAPTRWNLVGTRGAEESRGAGDTN